MSTKIVAIDTTKFFSALTHEPGQPGVFEVDPAVLDCAGTEAPRYSYFNGKDYGPLALTPEQAYAGRFGKRKTPVCVFRGLVEAAQ